MINCPNCNESIKDNADICSHCNFCFFGNLEIEAEYLKNNLNKKDYEFIRNIELTKNIRIRLTPKVKHCSNYLTVSDKKITGWGVSISKLSKDTLERVMELKDLTVLNLSFLYLKELSESIENLQKLKELNLSMDKLNTFPEYLCNLTSLEVLDLSHNYDIEKLPDSIEKLNNLIILNIETNKIKKLPNNFGELPSLEILNLKTNKLQELPNSFGKLTSLKKLNLRMNEIKEIPNSFGNLESLEWLNISQNPLKILPDNIGNLKNLKTFKMMSTNVTSLPESIGNLKNLKFIELQANKLTHLPNSIGNLKNIERLPLWGNNFSELPDSIGDLDSLTKLEIWRNPLKQIPDSLERLKSLETLHWAEQDQAKIFHKVLNTLANRGIKLIPTILKDTDKPFKGINMTLRQIREFLDRLAGEEGCQFTRDKWRCSGHKMEYSMKILDAMGISKVSQKRLLDLCREYGGFCDCEIIMNAGIKLLGESPW